MREVVLRVPRKDVERVLDRLLPSLPGGVREIERGDAVEISIRGQDLPSLAQIVALTGRPDLPAREHEISDDWRERRRADYAPDLIGGRLVVRPDWAPPAGAEIEIVLEEGPAFGAGTHPTTRACLELLLGLEPVGAFADLGCGSGVLAILAAKLGWDPVSAVDIRPESVELAQRNAVRNGASVSAHALDLREGPLPSIVGFAANIAPDIHRQLATALPDPLPRLGLVSGIHPGEVDQVLDAYRDRGLLPRRHLDLHGWSVVVLERPLPDSPGWRRLSEATQPD
jgi:ribosomal protein L11 methyltransferase